MSRKRADWPQGRRLARRTANRAGKPAILVVCEGEETEPNYLRGLCEARGINLANVLIVRGERDTDALRLIKKARQRFERYRDFDKVYVVCDCAGEDLTRALELASRPLRNASGEIVRIVLIVSRPSFEFWLLLHFEYTARPFQNAAEVIGVLRRHVTDYEKADVSIFAKVSAGFDLAAARATQLKVELQRSGSKIPDTDMATLIEVLNELRRR